MGWLPYEMGSGILATKMNARIPGHHYLLAEVQSHADLGKLLLGIIPANEAVTYAHHEHLSLFAYGRNAPASNAYAQVASSLVRYIKKRNVKVYQQPRR